MEQQQPTRSSWRRIPQRQVMEGGPSNGSPQTQQNQRQRGNRSGQATFQPYSEQQYSNLNSPPNLVNRQQLPSLNIAVWRNDFPPQQQNTNYGGFFTPNTLRQGIFENWNYALALATANQPQVRTNLVATLVHQFPVPRSREQNLNYTLILNTLAVCSNSPVRTSSVAPESSFLPGWQPLQSSSNHTDSSQGGLPQPQQRETNLGWYDEPRQETTWPPNVTPESSFPPSWQPLQSSSNYTDSSLGGLPQPQQRESNFGWYDEPRQETTWTPNVTPESSFLPVWQPLQSSSNYTDSSLRGLPQPQQRESYFGWYDEPRQETAWPNVTSAQQPQEEQPLTYAAAAAANAPLREPVRPPPGFEHLERKVMSESQPNESQPEEDEAMGQWDDEELVLNPRWSSKVKEDLVVMYEGRDILDLAHNLRF